MDLLFPPQPSKMSTSMVDLIRSKYDELKVGIGKNYPQNLTLINPSLKNKTFQTPKSIAGCS